MLRGKNGVIHVARVTRSAFLGIRVKRRKNNSACFFIILKSEEEWICKNRALTNELVRSESYVLRVDVHYLALALFVR